MADVVDLLRALVEIPSVVGKSNHAVISWLKGYLAPYDARITEIVGPEGDRSDLFVSVGPVGQPGIVLSGHMDVVPAARAEWTSDPFQLRVDGDLLYGRGTSDMKGFLASVLAVVPELKPELLKRPVHIALSYDEEAGCRGVPHLIKELPHLCAKPLGCIVGEPSGMVPVRAHKGKAAVRVSITGRAGHSSRPDLGLNAIHAMSRVMAQALQHESNLKVSLRDPRFDPPYSTLQIGLCSGGSALNIIPAHAELEMEVRAIPGADPLDLANGVLEILPRLEAIGFKTNVERLSHYPALLLEESAPLTRLLEQATGTASVDAVSYGTEAGLFQAVGIPAIICGPGDINRAHKPDEYIRVDELHNAMSMLRSVIDSTCR